MAPMKKEHGVAHLPPPRRKALHTWTAPSRVREAGRYCTGAAAINSAMRSEN